MIEERSVRIETNEDVDVRSFGVITSRDRTEQPHIMGAVAARDFENRFAFFLEDLPGDGHGFLQLLDFNDFPGFVFACSRDFFWQFEQKCVDRPPITMRLIGVPQFGHGCFSLW